jgi:NAD-dependent deacetylase
MEDINDEVIFTLTSQNYSDEVINEFTGNVKEFIENKNIIIFCGAGFSKDFGIDTFEDMKKINYFDFCSLDDYNKDVLNFYNNYNKLKEKCNLLKKIKLPSNFFVVTTNIDNIFETDNIYEIHGNINNYCCNNCKKIYNIIDTINVPICKDCNNIMRPNIQLYSDNEFIENEIQKENYQKFKEKISKENTVFIEIGCGIQVPLLRHESIIFHNLGYDVIRINIKDFDNIIPSIKLKTIDFLKFL